MVSQVNCAITTQNNVNICKADSVTISVQGNLQDIQWTDEGGNNIGKLASFKQWISGNKKFYVVNKMPFGPELIINGNFENGNQSFTSDYFTSCVEGYMPQGAYCVSDNSGFYHPGWSDCTDKSGSGLMLISDGAVVPNEKIWCQTVTVETNKDYAFSTWITAIYPVAPPIMQFSINNNLLGQPFQSSGTPCQWEEFFEIWNSENNTSAEICILNQNTEGEGNDFGIDEVSLRETCFSRDSVEIKLIDPIKIELGANKQFCPGETIELKNEFQNNNSTLQYLWSSGENTNSIQVTQPGKYQLSISTIENCTATDSVLITDIGTPINTLPHDTTLCFNAHKAAILKSGQALLTIWTYNGKQDTTDQLIATEEGIYQLTLSNGANCTIRDEITINDKCSYNLYIPNAFTPNNDGLNDTFGGHAFETYSFDLKIYNRWGNLIFHSQDLNAPWDGTVKNEPAPSDIYVYTIKYSVIDIYKNTLKEVEQQGTVCLIR